MLGSEGLQYSARLTVFPLGPLASIVEMHLTCFFLKFILVRGQLLGVLLSVYSKARALLFLYLMYSRIGGLQLSASSSVCLSSCRGSAGITDAQHHILTFLCGSYGLKPSPQSPPCTSLVLPFPLLLA